MGRALLAALGSFLVGSCAPPPKPPVVDGKRSEDPSGKKKPAGEGGAGDTSVEWPASTGEATGPATGPAGARPAAGPPLGTTQLTAALHDLSLDPAGLPALEKVDPDTLRKLMKTFTKSLGVQCSHCHDTKDFHAPTPNKKIATRMWNEYVRGLEATSAEGAPQPLYCDSCHGGRARFLDRSDKTALGAWMKETFVEKLHRRDGGEHGCPTCHGAAFEGAIFTRRWRVK